MYRRHGDISWDAAAAAAAEAGSDGGATPSAHTTHGAASAGVIDRPRTPWRVAPADTRFALLARRGRPSDRLPSVEIENVAFHAISARQCIDHILSEIDAGRGGTVVTPNLDHLRRYSRDLNFGALVAEADLVVADGMPIIWASRLQRTPLPERVAGSDLISTLSAAAAERNRSVFLLGGAPGTADAAAKVLRERHPTLRIVGTHCPPLGFEKSEEALAEMLGALEAAQPDIVFVALGSPKQEFLTQRLRKKFPSAWWLGVGVSFSFLSGDVKRAPAWMQRSGLEWVHRLLQEPRRLFYRYVVVGIPFGARMMSNSLLRGFGDRWGIGRRGRAVTVAPTVQPAGNGHASGNGAAATAAGALADAPVKPPIGTRLRRAAARPADSDGAVSAAAPRSLNRLRAVILLGGSVRPTELTTATGRSVLDLPLDEAGTIFNYWLQQAQDLARHANLGQLPVRVMVNHNSAEPYSAAPRYYGTYRVERDLSEYRGTGGLLRDLVDAADYDDDDLVLIANAAQILLDPLPAVATALDRKQAAVSFVAHQDGTPSGVQLFRCKTLRLIPETGYVDMKEQALPLIAGQHDVAVVQRRRPTGLPVRSLAGYVTALRHYHRRRLGKPAVSDPLAEDFTPAFALVEDGASVDVRAHVHDSVVLKGATVEAGAVLVRSLVCTGGVVRRDRSAVEQFVRGL